MADKNGHSHWYGYGRVNAEKAVALAKSHANGIAVHTIKPKRK